ncbi:MAG: DUF1080 domain-containing protein [Candidatus Hydrogenedentes bacterium]|nr:DUF1080 domain-containing protein [Candidatus Hydrogenedentota bacterium]
MKRRFLCNAFVALIVTLQLGAFAQNSATVPGPREDEWWTTRHAEKTALAAKGNVDLLWIGDSITHGWEGDGAAVWEQYYGHRKTLNIGYSGDQTQHVLWRLDHGEIDGISPKVAVIMIGTNNHGVNTVEEIAEGITAIVDKLHAKLPKMKILLLGIFPRADVSQEIQDKLKTANQIIAALDADPLVEYFDFGNDFLDDAGVLPKDVMPDLLHPGAKGYAIWAASIEPRLAELLGEYAQETPPVGYVPLFNGKDLTGWKGLVEDPEKRAAMSPEELATKQAEADKLMNAHWSVLKDGVLLFDGKGSHLCATRPYQDFEMLVDWKIEPKGDSGIYLRGSPQVQIWDPAQWPQGSGGLYNNEKSSPDPLVLADNPIGEWNRFHIKMIGDKVTVYLNNKLVVDRQVLENYWNREKPIYDSEQLELQAHGSLVWWKNIFVREIPRGDGWKPLFNGKDLSGWQEVDGKAGVAGWKAEDGILYTTGAEGGGWLSTGKEYGDFELELEFRVPENGNSGVFLRAPHGGNPASNGLEIQVLDDDGSEYTQLKPEQYCGSMYFHKAPTKRAYTKAGEWQKYLIRCEGQKIDVTLNGVHILDANLADHQAAAGEHSGVTRTQGFLGFQNHGSRLDYRNIRIRELK